MQHYDINIVPGGARYIDAVSSFIYFLDGSAGGADNTIEVRSLSGSEVAILRPGQSYRLQQGSLENRWLISNKKGEGTIIGTVLIGQGDFQDNRISGSVEVIDGGKARTMGGGAFLGKAGLVGVPSMKAQTQLWMPATSKKNAVVESFGVMSSADSYFFLQFNQLQMTGLVTGNFSKKSGGTVSTAELRSQSTIPVVTSNLILVAPKAGEPFVYQFKEPLVVCPGWGLCIINDVAGIDSNVFVEWYEEGV